MSILARLLADLIAAGPRRNHGRNDAAVRASETPAVLIQRRYLSLLTDSLLNEIYLENEVRFLYIFSTLLEKKVVDPDVVRQISLRLPDLVESVRAKRQEG